MATLLKKQVLLPISVPDGNYCYDGVQYCDYLDRHAGENYCVLNLIRVPGGGPFLGSEFFGKILKPSSCQELETELSAHEAGGGVCHQQ